MQIPVLKKPIENAIEIHMTPEDLLLGVEVPPFVRVVWHGPKAKQNWEPIFHRAATLHHRVEYEMVRRGHRRAATVHLTPANFDREIERIQKDGLIWLPIVRTKMYNGFSHRHYPTSPDDPNSSVYGVLAGDMESAKRFKEASEASPIDHRTIGELLGFPSCCTEFFEDIWTAGYVDPQWQAAERTPGVRYLDHRHAVVHGSILCSQILKYGGHRITSHLPCSFLCEESQRIGKVWWEVGLDIDPRASEALLKILSLPQEWSVLHGVAVVETPYFTLWVNSMPTREKWTITFRGVDISTIMGYITDRRCEVSDEE